MATIEELQAADRAHAEAIEELQAADRTRAEAISELRARVKGHDADIQRHDTMIAKLNETVGVLREAVAGLATKDDILKLSQNIDNKFNVQLAQANASIPAKVGIFISAASVVVMLISLYMKHG